MCAKPRKKTFTSNKKIEEEEEIKIHAKIIGMQTLYQTGFYSGIDLEKQLNKNR